MEDQVLKAVGPLIQGKKQLVVVLRRRPPQEAREISERLQHSWAYSHTPPQHRISSDEGFLPEGSTSSWLHHSIVGKLSHLATSGSGWAAE